MKTAKVKGFNTKEQQIYEAFAKTPGESCSIGELSQLFMKEAKKDAGKAQSFVRNSLRRLIRDGWVHKIGYGTYSLTAEGKRWLKSGKADTASTGSRKGRPVKKAATKKAAKKKAKAKVDNGASVRLQAGASEAKPVKAPPKLRRAKNREARREVGPDSAKERARELARQIAQEESA